MATGLAYWGTARPSAAATPPWAAPSGLCPVGQHAVPVLLGAEAGGLVGTARNCGYAYSRSGNDL